MHALLSSETVAAASAVFGGDMLLHFFRLSSGCVPSTSPRIFFYN